MRRIQTLLDRLCDLGLPATADENLRSRIRAEQIGRALLLTPLTMTSNVANAIVIVMLFWTSIEPIELLVWAALAIVVAGLGLRSWIAKRGRPAPTTASRRAIRRAILYAMLTGAIWTASLPLFFFQIDPPRQVLLSALFGGMISVGGFALASIPAAATTYVLVMVIGALLQCTLSGNMIYGALATMITVYGAIIILSIALNFRTFIDKLVSQAERDHQAEVISLLLHDFEESASDWLWETDAAFCLQHVSQRFAEKLGRPRDALRGANLIDLLAACTGGSDKAVEDLRRQMQARVAFHDLVVPLLLSGESRWWLLTAKPMHNERGEFAGYRGVGSDATDAKRFEQQIDHMARFDSLTGLVNRRVFHQRLREASASPHSQPKRFALLYLDLDNFKIINDAMSHAHGDAVLKAVAERLRTCVGDQATIARWGGDEFALLLDDPAEDLGGVARHIIEALSLPYDLDGMRAIVGTSIGIAMWPEHADDPDQLMRCADLALYRAKADGRGAYRFFEPAMGAEVQARRALEMDLRQALERDELTLHYQPIVAVSDEQLLGFEVLLRWDHPTLGVLAPTNFIGIAEESGLIVQLGDWVIRRACEEASTWPSHLFVAVNFSAVQFFEPALVGRVITALAASGLSANRFEIEITETVFLKGTGTTLATLDRLRQLGVRIALDDFGIGYSSLSYLRTLPIQKIKIDRSFIQELETMPENASIVRMIIELAKTLNLTITAEGVETEAQRQALAEFGCNQAQGFLFGRPSSAAAARERTRAAAPVRAESAAA